MLSNLFNDMIKGTEFEKNQAYKKEFKLAQLDGQNVVGISWYNKIYAQECKARDINRYSWFTVENFANVYDGVYSGMVSAGIAVEIDQEIMYDKNGEITTDESNIYGRPTKFKLTIPEYLHFVNKTGCNTNTKDDRYADSQLFVLPIDMEVQSG
jgi:hypothetical protein